jgi:hypothetical protein
VTIKVELSEAEARALLKFLQDAPHKDTLTENAMGHVRIALGKALGLQG